MGTNRNLEEALQQLRSGKAIILCDEKDREGEGDFAFAGCHSTPEIVNTALQIAKGILCIALRPEEAERLGIQRLYSDNSDVFDTPFGMPIDVINSGSGVSASARSKTIRAASDPTKTAADFYKPGHIATLIAHPMGLAKRKGHTEAIVDLIAKANLSGAGVLCEILNSRGEIASTEELKVLGKSYNFPILNISDISGAQRKTI